MCFILMHESSLWLPLQDEIFHIPQAQRYCAGEYGSWDPKITTFPGLYLLSAGLQGISHLPCDEGFLRAGNFALALLLLLALQACRKMVRGSSAIILISFLVLTCMCMIICTCICMIMIMSVCMCTGD